MHSSTVRLYALVVRERVATGSTGTQSSTDFGGH
jgi:hypothetical protein